MQIHRPVCGVPPFGHPLLQGSISFSPYGQDPPHVAPRVTVRVRCRVPPLPQGCVQVLHWVNVLTAQSVAEQRRLRRLHHPSVWSSIKREKSRWNQSDFGIIVSTNLMVESIKRFVKKKTSSPGPSPRSKWWSIWPRVTR